MFLRLIKAVTQWQMFPSGDPPKTKNFSAKFHAPSINSLEYRSNPLSYPLKYSFKCSSSSSSQKSRRILSFSVHLQRMIVAWLDASNSRNTEGWFLEERGFSLFFFIYIWWTKWWKDGYSLRRSCLVSTPACQSGAYLRGESRRLIFHVRQWLPVSTMGMDRACKRQTKREISPSLIYEEREREREAPVQRQYYAFLVAISVNWGGKNGKFCLSAIRGLEKWSSPRANVWSESKSVAFVREHELV